MSLLLVALFRLMLRLYPRPFRAMFAEEMEAVFRLVLAEGRGPAGLARGLAELAWLLPGALRERSRSFRSWEERLLGLGPAQAALLRRLARALLLVSSLFWLAAFGTFDALILRNGGLAPVAAALLALAALALRPGWLAAALATAAGLLSPLPLLMEGLRTGAPFQPIALIFTLPPLAAALLLLLGRAPRPALAAAGAAAPSHRPGGWPAARLAFGAAGAMLLLIAWWALSFVLLAFTEAWLVPWDTTPIRPPPGSLPRAVNDFFEGPPGSLLPAVLALAGGAVSLLLGLRRPGGRLLTIWLHGAVALLLILLNLIMLLASRLLAPTPPGWDGTMSYALTWPGIVALALSVLGAPLLPWLLSRRGRA